MANPHVADPASILDSVKKALGIESDTDVFDLDVIMHINSTFATLTQVGVGQSTGFVISDNTAEWEDFSPDMILLANVKSYIVTCVRLLFDPPATSFGLDAMQKTKQELEWRLNVSSEAIYPPSEPVFIDPIAPPDPLDPLNFDFMN